MSIEVLHTASYYIHLGCLQPQWTAAVDAAGAEALLQSAAYSRNSLSHCIALYRDFSLTTTQLLHQQPGHHPEFALRHALMSIFHGACRSGRARCIVPACILLAATLLCQPACAQPESCTALFRLPLYWRSSNDQSYNAALNLVRGTLVPVSAIACVFVGQSCAACS